MFEIWNLKFVIILSVELAGTYMFLDGDIDHAIFNSDLEYLKRMYSCSPKCRLLCKRLEQNQVATGNILIHTP